VHDFHYDYGLILAVVRAFPAVGLFLGGVRRKAALDSSAEHATVIRERNSAQLTVL
jgi:hypothetical protein